MTKRFHISTFKPSIFQGRLDFEAVSKRQTQVLAVEYRAERIIFTMLAALLAALFFAYFYFVIGSVLNVIGEKQADTKASNIQGSIAMLEQQYFSLSQSLTPQTAADMALPPFRTRSTYIDRATRRQLSHRSTRYNPLDEIEPAPTHPNTLRSFHFHCAAPHAPPLLRADRARLGIPGRRHGPIRTA